jgi:hypothetical protein
LTLFIELALFTIRYYDNKIEQNLGDLTSSFWVEISMDRFSKKLDGVEVP